MSKTATTQKQIAHNSIHLLAVARRARFGGLLKRKKEDAIGKFSTAKMYDLAFRNGKFSNTEIDFHDAILLMGVCGILETYLTDISIEFMVCFPGELASKHFSLEALVKKGSSSGLLRETAEREINEISYTTFPEMLKRLCEIFNFKKAMDAQLINELNEIKCTRDVYVHGNGTANNIYVRKAGASARVGLDKQLPLGKNYLNEAIKKSERFIEEFFLNIPSVYLEFLPVKAFREMWEATHLGKVMNFDEAWVYGGTAFVGGDPIVRPTKFALDWPNHSNLFGGLSFRKRSMRGIFIYHFHFSQCRSFRAACVSLFQLTRKQDPFEFLVRPGIVANPIKSVGCDFGWSSGAVLVGSKASQVSRTPARVRGVLVGLPGVVAGLDPRLLSGNPPG